MKLKRGPQTIFLSLVIVARIVTAVPAMRRDLAGVIGGLLDPDVHNSSITSMPKQTHAILTTTSTSSLAGETTKGHTNTRTAESISMETTATSSTLAMTTTTTEADGSSITPTNSWPTQTPNNMDHIAQDASHMAPEEATEWKVIGITVLSITVIGSMMLAALFSDTWIKLVKDVILGGNLKQKKYGDEELVPDWKRRSWEYMLADEEGHRYPPVSISLQSLAEKGIGSQTTMTTLDAATPMVPPPAPSYIPELDPHPLEPLYRRPSLKYQK